MFALLRLVLRLAGFFLLGVAVVAAVVDGSRSVAASGFSFTPLAEVWAEFSAESLALAGKAVVTHVGSWAWDWVIGAVLSLPVWAVAMPAAYLLLAAGSARTRREII